MQLLESSRRIILVVFFIFAGEAHAQGRYLGAGSCASSNCHGSVKAQPGSTILRNEYITWYKEEAHSRAFERLKNNDSKRIAQLLGLGAPDQEQLCLECHATYVAPGSRGPKFRLQDGVSCESCHGPSEGWIKSHTSREATHGDNVSKGMFDIVSLKARATICLKCHFGTDDQTVNHRLIGAGHPRLTFELDFFSLLQPNHWQVDDDYVKRKSGYSSARAWLVGQVLRSSDMMDMLLSKKRSKNGAMPELTAYYCYSCHHNLTADQWKQRTYDGDPGELRLNLSSLIMVREALAALDPGLSEQFSTQMKQLHDAHRDGTAEPIITQLKSALDGPIYQKATSVGLEKDTLRSLLKKIAGYAANTSYLQFEVAEQAYMGMTALTDAYASKNAAYGKKLDAIYATVSSGKKEEDFQAAAFTEATKGFAAIIE